MKLTDFDYSYPPELVAQHPLPTRDASRMMVVDRRAERFEHHALRDIINFLRPGDLFVLNDTRVLPLRLFGEFRKGRPIELLLVESATPMVSNEGSDPDGATGWGNRPRAGGGLRPPEVVAKERVAPFVRETWRCLAKKAKRIDVGEKIFFGMSAQATVVGHEAEFLLVEFAAGHRQRAMERRGAPPLPPYIDRDKLESYSPEDRERYQTVYAVHPGSAAAPTAGLHLSEALLTQLRERGVEIATVTLHVGLDTFRPIRAATLEEHRMHGERFEIPPETAAAINRAKREQRRIIACGTTTVRALESSWRGTANVPQGGITDIFITPGYTFRCIDGLLTNFHLPKSTLLLLVSAFAGRELIMRCYAEAIRERYRLFSFGDCMVIF